MRRGLTPLLLASASILALGAVAVHAQVPPPPVHWGAFVNFVDLYRQAYQPSNNARPTGNSGAPPQIANSSSPPTPPSSGGPPPDQGSPQQSPGFNPFGGGMGLSFGGGGGFGRGNDHGRVDDRRREDDRRQVEWEHQVDIMFPPTPRDPNYANAPPSPPPPTSNPPTGMFLTTSGGSDLGSAGLMAIFVAFVVGDWGSIELAFSSGGPPPPMVLTDDTFETGVQDVGDVVPIVGDSGGDPIDDIIM